MRHVVYLVQKGIISNQVVSGKSGKNYGTAVPVPSRGGVVLKMTMEEYTAAAQDIIGNTTPNQQWVPDIVPEVEAVPGRGKCGIPRGCANDAEFIWETHLFCRQHAPNNASPIDDKVIPLSELPPTPAPKVEEPVPPAPQPVVMPPPAVADEEVESAKVPAAGESTSVVMHEGTRFEFLPGAVRVGKTKFSTTLLHTLGTNEPNSRLWFRILKRDDDGTLLIESKEFEESKKPDEPIEGADDGLDKLPFPKLRDLAKERGMNIFQKSRRAMVAWVRKHPKKPDA